LHQIFLEKNTLDLLNAGPAAKAIGTNGAEKIASGRFCFSQTSTAI
jgi:hypothetical protein